MKTLLVLAEHPDFPEAIRAGVDPEKFRILHRTNLEEAEPLLAHGLAEACIIDLELSSVRGVWSLERLRRRAPKCPILIYTGAKQWEWEEEAYLQGATHVLSKPLRPRMFTALLDRLWPVAAAPSQAAIPGLAPPAPAASDTTSFFAVQPSPSQIVPILRNFSGILTQSLNADGLLK